MSEKKQSIGGIWEKQTQKGGKMLSISIEINGQKQKFIAFFNDYKNGNENAPDWKIFESTPMGNSGGNSSPAPAQRGNQRQQGGNGGYSNNNRQQAPRQQVAEDDLPF